MPTLMLAHQEGSVPLTVSREVGWWRRALGRQSHLALR